MTDWFDKLYGSNSPAVTAGCKTSWPPTTDIYQSQHGWLIKLELAGVRQDDVTVNVEGRRLTISGSRRDLIVNEDWSHYSMEIAYSRFERIVEMPCILDRDKLKAELRNGMLMIYVAPGGGEP